MDAFTEFLSICARAAWFEALWQATINYYHALGVTKLCYQHLPPFGAADAGQIRVISSGFDDVWNQKYIDERLYDSDPLPAQALAMSEPFLWSEIHGLREMTATERATLEVIEAAGKGDGLAIPVFGPGGRNGYFGIGLADVSETPSPATIRMFQAVCTAMHLSHCRIIQASLPENMVLSERERELMQLVAQGKSNSVIADIMSISPHTVDAYLRRVFSKVGASDRITAVLRCLGTGAIRGY